MAAIVYQFRERIELSRNGKAVGSTIPARRAVKISNAAVDGIDLATATTDVVIGVSAYEPIIAGTPGTFHMAPSIVQMTAGAAINRGQRCTVDGSGRAVVAASGNVQIGIAMSDAGALGAIFEMQISELGTVAP